MNEQKTLPVIPPLTGVRFLAALLVFLFHYNPFHGASSETGRFLEGIFDEMYIGVGLFFVLSGFLIAYNYFEKADISFSFYKKYMVRRVARIYPVYFVITTLYFLYWFLNGQTGKHFLEVYLLNITFIKGFSSKTWMSGIFQGWSLTVEETFYFLAPFIFYFIKRGYFFVQIVFFILTGLILVLLFNLFPFEGFFSDVHFLFVATFFGRCFEFFAGILLAVAIRRGQLLKPSRGGTITILGLSGIFFCLVLMKEVCNFFHVPHASSHIACVIVHNFMMPFFAIMFFYGLIIEKTIVQRFFSSGLVVLLGKSSYVFYLIHAGLIASFVGGYFAYNIFVLFALLQLLSIAIYYLLELPTNKFIRRIFSS